MDEAIEKRNAVIEKTKELKKGLMQELLTRGIGHKKFKKTELGEIPAEWDVVKLENIASFEYGEGLPKNKREGNKYPVYGSNGIVGYHNAFLVKGPGIIVGRKGTIGSVTYCDRNFWPIDTTYYVAANVETNDLKWMFYYLKNLRMGRLNAATGIPGLNRQVALDLKIALPLLTEQKKIAEILSSVDEEIEKGMSHKDKLKEIKKGLMQNLLTGKLRVKI